MEIFDEAVDVDSKQQIMKLESFELKKEFSDTKEFFKHETNETVHDNSNDFMIENGEKSDNLEYKLFIKKESTCNNPSKYDCDTSQSSCQTEGADSFFKSNATKNYVVKKKQNVFYSSTKF